VANQCRVFHNEPAIDPGAARTRKEYGMTSKWERRATLAGALAVPFWLAGIILFSTKAKGSEGPKILASYHQHSDGILLGGFLWSLGILLFIWFLGSLRSHYLAAEGGAGRLTALAYSGGLLAATLGLLIPGPDSAGALEKKHLDASGAAVLHNLPDAFFIGAEYVLAILFFASGILALRHGALPKWLGWVSVLIGIVLLIGPIGWAALIFATPIWTLIVSVLLYMRTETSPALGQPAARPAS
jgi:hypothetical protein